jgi:hypothetical protein
VNLPGDHAWFGTMRRVRIVAAAPNSLRGEAVGESVALHSEVAQC